MKFDIGILASQPLPVIVRQVQLAESLGYDTAWIADTHLVCRELWVTLAACAAGTSRIRLGPGIAVPHTRHVSVTASAIVGPHSSATSLAAGCSTAAASAKPTATANPTCRLGTALALAICVRSAAQASANAGPSVATGRLTRIRAAMAPRP